MHWQYCVVTEVHLLLSQLNTTNNCLTLTDARRRPRQPSVKFEKHTLGSVSCTPRALPSASVDLHVFRGPVYGKQDDLSIAIQDRMTLPARRAQAADAGVVFAQLALIGCQKLQTQDDQTTHTPLYSLYRAPCQLSRSKVPIVPYGRLCARALRTAAVHQLTFVSVCA